MRVVLAGGGHAHIAALRHLVRCPLGRRPLWLPDRPPCPALTLVLVSRAATSLYSGMLPGVIRRDYAEAQARVDVAALAARAGVRLVLGEIAELDLGARVVRLADGGRIGFDVLSLDVGGRSAPLPGAIPVRPIEALLPRLAGIESSAGEAGTVVVAGGGPAGVELALALGWRWRGTGRTIVLATRGASVLPLAPAAVRARAARALAAAGIAIRRGSTIEAFADGAAWPRSGPAMPAAAVLCATATVAPSWIAATGLATDASGCVRVDASLRSLSHPWVLAAGDCAALATPRPKGGVWAVRAGPALVGTLRAMARDRPPPAWQPPGAVVQILGLGGGRALLWRGRLRLEGSAAWRFKDWLDRRWVADALMPPRGAAGR